MQSCENPEVIFDDYRNLFPRNFLTPKVIRLRNSSQKTHIRRIQAAYQIKQKGQEDVCPCYSSPIHGPSSTTLKSPFTIPRSVQNTGNDIKSYSEPNKNKGTTRRRNCISPNNDDRDGNKSQLLSVKEFSKNTQTNNSNSVRDESKLDRVLKTLDCKLMKNKSTSTNIPENGKELQLSSILYNDKQTSAYNANENKCISMSENALISNRPMFDAYETRAENFFCSNLRSEMKKESPPAQSSSNESESFLFETPKENHGDKKKYSRVSKIPLSLNRLRKMRELNGDVYAMSSEGNTKCEVSFLSNPVRNLFDFTNKKQETSVDKVENSKSAVAKWDRKYDDADSSSSLYSCRSEKNTEMSSESSPGKDSPISLWRKGVKSIDDGTKDILDTSDFVRTFNKTKISESSEFHLQNTKITENENISGALTTNKKRGLKSGENFHGRFDEAEDGGIFLDIQEKNMNDNDGWKSSDDEDFSSASSGQCLLETMTDKPENEYTVFDSLTFPGKPKRYSTPYNLRYPRYKPAANSSVSTQLMENSRVKSSRSVKKYTCTPKRKTRSKPKTSKKNKSASKKKK